jgi:hypothetical protein
LIATAAPNDISDQGIKSLFQHLSSCIASVHIKSNSLVFRSSTGVIAAMNKMRPKAKDKTRIKRDKNDNAHAAVDSTGGSGEADHDGGWHPSAGPDLKPSSAEMVEGIARSVQRRQDAPSGWSSYQSQVLTLRIERYDSSGNRLQPVPVELRGTEIRGTVVDGDIVQVRGKVIAGAILSVKKLDNRTSGTVVVAHTTSADAFVSLWNKAFIGCFVVILAGALIAGLIAAIIAMQK